MGYLHILNMVWLFRGVCCCCFFHYASYSATAIAAFILNLQREISQMACITTTVQMTCHFVLVWYLNVTFVQECVLFSFRQQLPKAENNLVVY